MEKPKRGRKPVDINSKGEHTIGYFNRMYDKLVADGRSDDDAKQIVLKSISDEGLSYYYD